MGPAGGEGVGPAGGGELTPTQAFGAATKFKNLYDNGRENNLWQIYN